MTVGKDEYLLEVPESLQGVIPRDYELQSSKKVHWKSLLEKVDFWLLHNVARLLQYLQLHVMFP